MMFIWACGPAQHFPEHEMLLGQVNIPLKNLQKVQNGDHYLVDKAKIILSNQEVGEVSIIKLKYSVVH